MKSISPKYIITVLIISFWIVSMTVSAGETGKLRLFKSGSYRQLLEEHTGQPFVLSIWSVDCPSCLKDMEILKKIHQGMPNFSIVLLTMDNQSAAEEVNSMLTKQGLSDLESWIFADDNVQKLRFEIDPQWYGEIPRTYFYNRAHERQGISGALTFRQFITQIKEILKDQQQE